MRLKELSLKNFRGYRNQTKIPIDPCVTGITGRNDVGKSSILEALDIFLDGGEVSLDKDDFNVAEPNGVVEISCIFDGLPTEIVLDESHVTSLEAEHLLNSAGCLEILKRYKRTSLKSPQTFIIANHPTASDCCNLHTLKLSNLKQKAGELGITNKDVSDARINAYWRRAIWEKTVELHKEKCELEISKFAEDSKTIQDKLFRQLPLFALFKSDRQSKDGDSEAKSPLQEAVKQAQNELKVEIEQIQQEIQKRVLDRANKTLEKLKEMDPFLAKQLIPRFKAPPKWTFDFTLDGEDEIPINKRGSGVRRIILLNFFRAEAERRVANKNAPSVIYAFEEPETSQHPTNQEMLVRALIKVTTKENCQVLLTTHVPALAGLLPTDGLRLVENAEVGVAIHYGSDEVLKQISESLGVLPDSNVTRAKALLLVEGPGDLVFIRHSAQVLKDSGHLPTTLEEKDILPVCIGGCGNLKHWQTKNIADQFGIPWGLLLDSDIGTQEEERNRMKVQDLRVLGKKAYTTRKREPENYILPEVVIPFLKSTTTISYNDSDDAKLIIGNATEKRPDGVLEFFWPKMTAAQIRQTERYVDEKGIERFELTEMLMDFLDLT